MKFAVIQFPGSNCDQDCIAAINGIEGLHAEYVWHKETSLERFRCDRFARRIFLRRLSALRRDCAFFADHAGGIERSACGQTRASALATDFKFLCEAGLLPGALVRNRSLRFRLRRW